MNYTSPLSEACPSQALKLLGDYTTLRIVDTLRTKELRFRELARELADINPVTLTNRLKRMSEVGILSRHEETIDRQSVTYKLTEMGNGLIPILQEIQDFAEKFKILD